MVKPYFRQCAPPEFSATFPPIVQTTWLDGSGAKYRLSGATAAEMPRLVTPGWTTARWFSASTDRISRIRASPMTMPSATGSAPPDRPVPAPRATNAMPFAGANPNHCRNLFRADRKHNQRGNDPKTGEPVALISAKLSRLRDQAAFADQPADLPADLLGDPPYGPLTDQLEVGRCHRHRLHSTSSRYFGSATHSMSPRAQHLIPRTERRPLAPITTVALPTEGCRETPEPPTRKRYVRAAAARTFRCGAEPTDRGRDADRRGSKLGREEFVGADPNHHDAQ